MTLTGEETTDKKTLNEEPDIPFAEALSVPMQGSAPVEATPTTPTATAIPTGAAPPATAPVEATPTGTAIPTGAPPATAPATTGTAGGVYHISNLGHQPKSITCPNCQQSIRTQVDHSVDAYTIVFCVLILFFVLASVLPLVLPPCKAAVHICPKCRKQLGKSPTCCG